MTVTTKITGLSRTTTASVERQFRTAKRLGQLDQVAKTFVVWNVDPTGLLVIVQSEMDELFAKYGADDRDRKALTPLRDRVRAFCTAEQHRVNKQPEWATCVQVNTPPEDADIEQVAGVIDAVAELYVIALEHKRYAAALDLLTAAGFEEKRWPEKDEMINLLADVLS